MEHSSIGIKLADGSFYPIMEEGAPSRKKLVLTTVSDDQANVQINLYRGEEDIEHSSYVGSLLIENIPSREKGEPEIELIVGLDEEGNLSAEASESTSGERRSLSVSIGEGDAPPAYDMPDFDLSTEPEEGFEPDFSFSDLDAPGDLSEDFSEDLPGDLPEDPDAELDAPSDGDFDTDFDSDFDEVLETPLDEEAGELDFPEEAFPAEEAFSTDSLDELPEEDELAADDLVTDDLVTDDLAFDDLSVEGFDDLPGSADFSGSTDLSGDSDFDTDTDTDFDFDFDEDLDSASRELYDSSGTDSLQNDSLQEDVASAREDDEPWMREPEKQSGNGVRKVLITLLVILSLAFIGLLVYCLMNCLPGEETPPLRAAGEGGSAVVAPADDPGPTAPVAEETGGEGALAQPEPKAPERTSSAGATPVQQVEKVRIEVEGVWYRIRRGDTLWDISSSFYNTPWLYGQIANENNIKNPDLIFTEQKIFIPTN